MSQLSEESRIAVLEKEMEDLKAQYVADMNIIKTDLKDLLGKFNQMTGGQKAWFGLMTLVGGFIGLIVGLLSAHR